MTRPKLRPMPNMRRARFAFKFEDVFPEDDEMARYVVRLSTGLGDLKTVARHVTRKRQTNAQRTYFVRLMASHLHEIALVLDPGEKSVVPDGETFLSALPRGKKPPRADIRKAHSRAIKALASGGPTAGLRSFGTASSQAVGLSRFRLVVIVASGQRLSCCGRGGEQICHLADVWRFAWR